MRWCSTAAASSAVIVMGVCGIVIRQDSRINTISHLTVNAPYHWTNSSKKHSRFFKTKGSCDPAFPQGLIQI
jgi:hypothetical protein